MRRAGVHPDRTEVRMTRAAAAAPAAAIWMRSVLPQPLRPLADGSFDDLCFALCLEM